METVEGSVEGIVDEVDLEEVVVEVEVRFTWSTPIRRRRPARAHLFVVETSAKERVPLGGFGDRGGRGGAPRGRGAPRGGRGAPRGGARGGRGGAKGGAKTIIVCTTPYCAHLAQNG